MSATRTLRPVWLVPSVVAVLRVSVRNTFQGNATGNGILIGDVTNVGPGKYVLIERDGAIGAAAAVKRLYFVDLAVTDERGLLQKALLVDLLRIADPAGIGGSAAPAGVSVEPGRFSMALGGLEAPGTPDNTEVVRTEFADALDTLSF